MKLALVGNQNCGKTTLFNQLTGVPAACGQLSRRDGGEKGRVWCKRHRRTSTVVDLPGIYSLSPYSSEEVVTRDFLIEG